MGSVDPTLPPPQSLGGHDATEITPEMLRANAAPAFIGSPLLPEPDRLRVDNIATLLSLSVEVPVQIATLRLLSPTYSQHEVEAIWTSWAPHFAPPNGHPLSGGTLLRDTILQALWTAFPTATHTKEAAATLVGAVAAAVTTHTFLAHTATDLDDEEMEVTTPPSPYNPTRAHPLFPLIHLMEPAPPHAY
jgi:hypothetical protein